MAGEDPKRSPTLGGGTMGGGGMGAAGCAEDDAPRTAGSFAGCSLPKNHLLTDEGWEWRGNADQRRCREMTDTYEELGFEVKLEGLNLDQLSEGCFGCKDVLNSFSAIYVRKKS